MKTTTKATAKKKLVPLALTAAIIFADQITKFVVTSTLPIADPVPVIGDLLRFTYVRNPAALFSLGRDLPVDLQRVLFFILPLAAIAGVSVFYFTTSELTNSQRWAIGAVLGGGIGNQIDRIIHPDGVVDFIDVKCCGFFGLERWPVFNIADSTVVVAGIFLIITLIAAEVNTRKKP